VHHKKVEREMEALKSELLESTKSEVQKKRELWTKDFERDQKEAYLQLKDQITTEIFSTVKKSIQSLSNLPLEEAIASAFISQIKKEKEKFLPIPSHMQFKTALEISEQMQEKIRKAFQEEFGKEIVLEFSPDPQLIAGIALYMDGKKISWNVQEYLANLEKPLLEP
jgi:F-type H+-transporting ATPase subunit b